MSAAMLKVVHELQGALQENIKLCFGNVNKNILVI